MDNEKIDEFDRAMTRDRLAKGWLAHQRGESSSENYDVQSEMWHLCATDPKERLEVVLEIISRESDEDVLGVLAAGPLEDLIQESGAAVIDRIEEEARSNTVFRGLLGQLWLSVDPRLFARVHRAAGSPEDMKRWEHGREQDSAGAAESDVFQRPQSKEGDGDDERLS